MSFRRTRSSRLIGALLVACSLALGGAGVSLAQEATPSGTAAGHPAHIHEGTCDNLNPAPQFPLNDVAAPAGATSAEYAPVEMSVTTVDTTLASVADGKHAINVHESAQNIATYIACGDLSGPTVAGPDGSTTLAIGLHELNGSGYSGIAVLKETGSQIEVSVYLAQGLSGSTEATPSASQTGHAHAMDAVQIDIQNFAFNPDPVTISAGQSVTWTNKDSAPHTATAQDRAVLQSGTLNQGDSFTQTFDTPGTYEYFCEFHPNMKGTIIVQ